MVSARDEIINKLKKAEGNRSSSLTKEVDQETPIYHPLDEPLELEFKKNLEVLNGRVFFSETLNSSVEILKNVLAEKKKESLYCIDSKLIQAFNDHLKIDDNPDHFQDLNIGITRCEYLVAHLGSVLITSSHVSGRRLNVFPETHIIIADKNQLVDYLDNAMHKLQEKYKNNLPSLITNITGPSRTADIEKTLVLGMHGPKDLIVIITENQF